MEHRNHGDSRASVPMTGSGDGERTSNLLRHILDFAQHFVTGPYLNQQYRETHRKGEAGVSREGGQRRIRDYFGGRPGNDGGVLTDIRRSWVRGRGRWRRKVNVFAGFCGLDCFKSTTKLFDRGIRPGLHSTPQAWLLY